MTREDRTNRFKTGATAVLIAIFLVPLIVALTPAAAEARHNDNDRNRLEEINEEIQELIDRLVELFKERRELLRNGDYDDDYNDYPDYVDPRLIEARATVYSYDSDKKTRVVVVYDRKERTFYTTAQTRSGIIRAIARYYDISERAVDRVLEINYVRSSRDYDDDDHDEYAWSNKHYQKSYDYDEYDGERWWGDATYGYISDEELAREKETWWDDDGY